ncbi:MAG: BatA and WFA domain-containing protein [Flavobacteriales bacterium]|nr:BatA and WFA domain-containing protein [Flavobacteriales bacterium]
MNFLFPGFLVALTALAVPVIIHLFRFRRFKKVIFTNVSLLKEVDITRKNRQQLKHLLVMLMRMLAIAALVFAFAKPYFSNTPGVAGAGPRKVSIYVDNSFSMDREAENGRLLNQAKITAEEIANAYAPSDKFQLITNDFEGRHARFYPRDEFLNLLAETELSPTGRNISEVVNRQLDLLKKEGASGSGRIYLISDFPRTGADFDQIRTDSSVSISVLPLKAGISANLYVDSVWLQTPNTGVNIPLTLKFRVKNTGETEAEDIPVKLFLNGEQKTPTQISVPAGGSAEGELFFTVLKTGAQTGKVQIEDNSLTFDNEFYFSFQVAQSLDVLVLNDAGSAQGTAKVYSGDEYFKLTTFNLSAPDYSRFPSQNLIVLNGITSPSDGLVTELKKYAEAGGNLMIIPGLKADVNVLNRLHTALKLPPFGNLRSGDFKATSVNTEGTFFSDIFESVPKNPDLPTVKNYYPISGSENHETVIKLNTGDALFGYFTTEKGGKVFYSSVAADDQAGNFHRHALFVPVMLKSAFLSQTQTPLFYYAGAYAPAEMNRPEKVRNDEAIKWIHTENGYEFIPEQRTVAGKLLFYPGEYLEQAGNYKVMAGETEIGALAYNYPRTESQSDFHTEESLKTQIQEAGIPYTELINASEGALKNAIDKIENGAPIWKWLIIATLLFLFTELVLLRFWK